MCIRDSHTVEELLSYYPFRYEVFKERALSEWQINDTVTCEATILSRPHVMRLGGKRSMTRFAVQVQDQEFQAVLFNRPWTSQFQPGRVMTLSEMCIRDSPGCRQKVYADVLSEGSRPLCVMV